MSEDESVVPIIDGEVLRRLSIRGDKEKIREKLDKIDSCEERFTLLYNAAIRSGAPVRRLLTSFEPLLSYSCEDALISLAKQEDSRDIMLQVGLASLLWTRRGDARMIELILQRVALLAYSDDLMLCDHICKVLAGCSREKLAVACPEPSAGMIIILGCFRIKKANMAEISKWISENATHVESMPLLLCALGKLIDAIDYNQVKESLLPALTRMLLRSPATALNVVLGLGAFQTLNKLLVDLGDVFWSQAVSENDDCREKAHRILLLGADNIEVLRQLQSTYPSRSVKAKKSLLFTLYKMLKKQVTSDIDTAVISGLLAKETNEELVYLLLAPLALASPKVVLADLSKQNKPMVKSAYLAALCLSEVKDHEVLMAMTTKKDLSPIDCLLLTINLAGWGKLSMDWIRSGLKTGGFLTEKIISDAAHKYLMLPIYRLVGLFPAIASEHECCRILWKSLIASNQFRDITALIAKMPGPLPVTGLASVSHDISSSIDRHTAILVAKMIKACIRTRADKVEFDMISFYGRFYEINLWRILNSAKNCLSSDNSQVCTQRALDGILEAKTADPILAVTLTLPEVIATFGSLLVEHLKTLVSLKATEDDLQILRTPREKLPIIDVVTPIRRAQEAAARKDATKKLLNPAVSSTQQGLSKTEKAAFDAELQREKDVKASLMETKRRTDQFTLITKVISESNPSALEPFLGEAASMIPKLVSLDWIAEEAVPLFYALSRCCHLPMGKFGPLLITCLLVLCGQTHLIDHDWRILDKQQSVAASVYHLTNVSLTSKSTFCFMLPTILEILRKSNDIGLNEQHTTILLKAIEANAKHSLDAKSVMESLNALVSLLTYLPATMKAATGAALAVIAHSTMGAQDLDQSKLVGFLNATSQHVRKFGLEVITGFLEKVQKLEFEEPLRAWVAILQSDPFCSLIASELVESANIKVCQVSTSRITDIILDDSFDDQVSTVATRALCSSALRPPSHSSLASRYHELLDSRAPEMANIRSKNLDLTVISRLRLATLYLELAKSSMFSESSVPEILKFYLESALFDPNEHVQTNFLNSVTHLLENVKDKAIIDSTAKTCEELLSRKTVNRNDDSADRVRVYGVIIMSKLADRFAEDDPRKMSLLASLFGLLVTPSESVQNAVADAMVSLFASAKQNVLAEYVTRLMEGMIRGKSIAARRGCAYGLGALTKGFGSRALKHYEILPKLLGFLQDRNESMESKQGALFGIELLAFYLGRNFEPYIIRLLDCLIVTFADGRAEIKEATSDAADMMMRCVTSLGSQLILPILLSLMDTNSWRSKVGALEWLGAMANLAPRVLAKQLPKILPKILDSLGDSHHAVQTASREALHRYVTVIRNPEVRALAPLIMDALSNPPQYTERCLDSILHTAFAHVIDAPSMALLEPVLVRALKDRAARGTETKKKSAQILGNLATDLIDPRDLSMFLNSIAPALVTCLSDPVPEVRANCGKVLGILVEITGEDALSMRNLVPELLAVIGGPFATSVDRAGAAQALAEIFAARGPVSTTKILCSQVLPSLSSPKACMREGYAMLVGYLPAAFDVRGSLTELYEDGVREVIAPTIGLLADDNEAVREAATSACHQIISSVARIDRVAIFDVLMDTLSDPRWRCRLGCLQLFQEFLSKFASGESDSAMGIFATPSADDLIEGGIDAERVNKLMAKAFLYRFDRNSSVIRHHALTIWKGLASHPLRALSQVLPLLVEESCEIITKDAESQEMVAKALEDVLSKIGDRVIITLLETVKKLFDDEHEVASMFIACQAAKLFGSAAFPSVTGSVTEQVMHSFSELIQIGLYSANDKSRVQACNLFRRVCDTSARIGASGTVEAIIIPMLDELTSDPIVDPVTLAALSSLLRADESGEVLKLTIRSIIEAWKGATDVEQGATLCSITSTVFDCVGSRSAHVSVKLLQVMLVSSLYKSINPCSIDGAIKSLLSSLEADSDSPYQVSLSQFLEGLYADDRAIDCFRLIRIYCSVEQADLSRFYNIWQLRLIEHLSESEEARDALTAMIESIAAESLTTFTSTFNSGLQKAKRLDAPCKSIVATSVKNLVIPLLLSTNLLAAEDEERRNLACCASSLLAEKASLSAWSGSLSSLVGALIRAASDRKTTGVAVFEALTCCVVAQTGAVKPFYPQLQRIFLNGLAMDAVQQPSIDAMTSLLPVLSRPEQTINELMNIAETEGDGQISAIRVLEKTLTVGDPQRCIETARNCLASNQVVVREAASRWAKAISTLPQMSEYKSQLLSLLKMA